MANPTNTPAVAPAAPMQVTYEVMGQKVTLNADMVRKYLTKGDGNFTDQEVYNFICICKYQQINPFLNEAYLVKYNNNRGGEANATIVVGKEAYIKRAEGNENYDGFRAGIIVKRGEHILELEGAFKLPTDVLLGGWAEVYRSDRKHVFVEKVSLEDYDKNRSTWSQIKCSMIRKVALNHALREAFPAQLGSIYTREELNIEDVDFEDVHEAKVQAKANAAQLPEEEGNKPAEAQETKEPAAAPANGGSNEPKMEF